MKTFLAALLMLGLLAGPARQADAQSAREEAEEAIKEGAQAVLRALESLVSSIPQYEAPEVLDNGDIIIRRKHKEPPPPPEFNNDETAT